MHRIAAVLLIVSACHSDLRLGFGGSNPPPMARPAPTTASAPTAQSAPSTPSTAPPATRGASESMWGYIDVGATKLVIDPVQGTRIDITGYIVNVDPKQPAIARFRGPNIKTTEIALKHLRDGKYDPDGNCPATADGDACLQRSFTLGCDAWTRGCEVELDGEIAAGAYTIELLYQNRIVTSAPLVIRSLLTPKGTRVTAIDPNVAVGTATIFGNSVIFHDTGTVAKPHRYHTFAWIKDGKLVAHDTTTTRIQELWWNEGPLLPHLTIKGDLGKLTKRDRKNDRDIEFDSQLVASAEARKAWRLVVVADGERVVGKFAVDRIPERLGSPRLTLVSVDDIPRAAITDVLSKTKEYKPGKQDHSGGSRDPDLRWKEGWVCAIASDEKARKTFGAYVSARMGANRSISKSLEARQNAKSEYITERQRKNFKESEKNNLKGAEVGFANEIEGERAMDRIGGKYSAGCLAKLAAS